MGSIQRMPCYKAISIMLLAALCVCPVVRVFFLLYAYIFLCLSVYFVSFVLLFDSSTLGLHFLCVQGVFSLYCLLPGWSFVFWSGLWFQWHDWLVFLFVFLLFCDLLLYFICLNVFVWVRVLVEGVVCLFVCLLAFLYFCVHMCLHSVLFCIFSFICTYIFRFMSLLKYFLALFDALYSFDLFCMHLFVFVRSFYNLLHLLCPLFLVCVFFSVAFFCWLPFC